MSDVASPRMKLPYLQPGQAQKEITHNEALQLLDMLVQPVAESADLAAPPAAPEEGRCWIVAMGAAGAWAGRTGQIAQWTIGGWRFSEPAEGWRCHVRDRATGMMFDGSAWIHEAVRSDALYLDGERVLTVRQPAIVDPTDGATIDAEARSAIAAILDRLRVHGLIEN